MASPTVLATWARARRANGVTVKARCPAAVPGRATTCGWECSFTTPS